MSDEEIIQAIKTQADSGPLSFRDFMQVALYHPQHGYYSRNALRVGRQKEADFYTAESMGEVFARLVLAAADSLLAGHLHEYCFVELGAETGQSPLAEVAAQKASGYRALGPADTLSLEGPCVVFGNEVLDAQPFHRLVFKNGQWHECGVEITLQGLHECLLPELSPEVQNAKLPLPAEMPEGYRLDIALEAERLLENILKEPWQGLLLQLDYGRSWEELITARPAGTARAYYRHEASGELLARPGQQDLTSHVCWDRLETTLRRFGCSPKLQRQEAFFVLNAESEITRIVQAQANTFDSKRQSLMELIHPHHMGAKFQVLSALKGSVTGCSA